MGARDPQVQARRAVGVEAERGEFVGDQPMVQPHRLFRGFRAVAVQGAEQVGRTAPPRQRGPQPLHPPPLLVDEHRRSLVVGGFAQGLDQGAGLVGPDDIAGEQDEAPWADVAEQGPLVRRERLAGAAQDAGGAHRSGPVSPGPGSCARSPSAIRRTPGPRRGWRSR